MKKLVAFSVLLLLILMMTSSEVSAQCAMCRATAESATNNGNRGIGEGLNTGIVYLMIAPYVLMGLIAFVFFRKKIIAFLKA